MTEHDLDLPTAARELSEALWATYHARPNAPHLVWPRTRDGSRRISEQESKILLTQWLEHNGFTYSIETPSTETYRQSGRSERSARPDATVYSGPDGLERTLNVELKAKNPDAESFRKDFEKLLRERVPGLWFHTLERATATTWKSLSDKIGASFNLEAKNRSTADHEIFFAFCRLDSPALVTFSLDFGGDWNDQWPTVMTEAVLNPIVPEWYVVPPPKRRTRPTKKTDTRTPAGPVEKRMIFCPDIQAGTFVHLSISGERYQLRRFHGGKSVTLPKVPGCDTTSQLRERYDFLHDVDVAGEKKSLKQEAYWLKRTQDLNASHQLR